MSLVTIQRVGMAVGVVCISAVSFWLGAISGTSGPAREEQRVDAGQTGIPAETIDADIDEVVRGAREAIADLDRATRSAREVLESGLTIEVPAFAEIVDRERAKYRQHVAATRFLLRTLDDMKAHLEGEQWTRVDTLAQTIEAKLAELEDAYCAIDLC